MVKSMILIDKPMPEACDVCPCMYDFIQCTALKDDANETLADNNVDYTVRQKWCPLKEVVMCKDCKYGEKANAVYLCGKIRGFGIAHEPKWFCADGEAKA